MGDVQSGSELWWPGLLSAESGTFAIMRAAQLASWSDALLESYLTDLKDATLTGRNLLADLAT